MISDSSLSKIAQALESFEDESMEVSPMSEEEHGASVEQEMQDAVSENAMAVSEILGMFGDHLPQDIKMAYASLLEVLDSYSSI